jgi:hypothetical protein
MADDENADRLKKALEQAHKDREADHYRRRMLWPRMGGSHDREVSS